MTPGVFKKIFTTSESLSFLTLCLQGCILDFSKIFRIYLFGLWSTTFNDSWSSRDCPESSILLRAALIPRQVFHKALVSHSGTCRCSCRCCFPLPSRASSASIPLGQAGYLITSSASRWSLILILAMPLFVNPWAHLSLHHILPQLPD